MQTIAFKYIYDEAKDVISKNVPSARISKLSISGIEIINELIGKASDEKVKSIVIKYNDVLISANSVKKTYIQFMSNLCQSEDKFSKLKKAGWIFGETERSTSRDDYGETGRDGAYIYTNCNIDLLVVKFVKAVIDAEGEQALDDYFFEIEYEAIQRHEEKGYFDDMAAVEELRERMAFDHNLILFGPPGTGKTYNTAIYAVAICDEKPLEQIEQLEYSAIMSRYNDLKKEGRIAFTTFHQSYGYEEFIEGIKPVIAEGSSDVGYMVEPGVFKKFCDTAKVVQGENIEYTGTVWAVRNRQGDSDVDRDFEKKLYDDGVIKVENSTDCKRQTNLIKDMAPGDWVVLGKNYSINAIGVVIDEEPEEIDENVFHVQRRIEWKATNLSISCKEINRGKCISNFVIDKSAMKVQDLQKIIDKNTTNERPYVFIVDEINRGNISKIFGELITLIEATKREGLSEAVSAILPYSGEQFSVPANVYILGTMNTADRSIALMDTALRRRFSFVEMMPKSDVLRKIRADYVENLDVAEMLDKINERITFLYDREHTIGHAFFTGLRDEPTIEKLGSIFEKSVIPLLQEYFYEDYQKIQLVLGDNGKTDEGLKFIVDQSVVTKDIFKGNVDDVADLPEKKYIVNKKAFRNLQSYLEIM